MLYGVSSLVLASYYRRRVAVVFLLVMLLWLKLETGGIAAASSPSIKLGLRPQIEAMLLVFILFRATVVVEMWGIDLQVISMLRFGCCSQLSPGVSLCGSCYWLRLARRT